MVKAYGWIIQYKGQWCRTLLENDYNLILDLAVRLGFPTSNIQIVHEAFLDGLRMTFETGEEEIIIKPES